MSDLPEPLTPADCDLRDFAFMPLDVVRLRDSDLTVLTSGDEFRCAVLLWCASWHQVPAASLPDDDIVLAQYAGFGRVVKEWKKVRDAALRGWMLCFDGRFYHPVVAEKARDAWVSKLKQRHRTECGRIKKHNERNDMKIPYPEFDAWMSLGCPVGQALPVPSDNLPLSPGQLPLVPGETHSKGYRQGQGQGLIKTPPAPTFDPAAELKARGVTDETAKDWLDLRRQKRAKVSATALKGIINEADKAGLPLERALSISCRRGWTGFEAAWLKDSDLLAPAAVAPKEKIW